jgi:hypothetical protein
VLRRCLFLDFFCPELIKYMFNVYDQLNQYDAEKLKKATIRHLQVLLVITVVGT